MLEGWLCNMKWRDLLVSWLALGVARIVGSVLAALLTVLEASLRRRSIRVHSLWWAVALRHFAILRLLRITWLTISLRRPLLRISMSVVWWVLIIWV